MTLTMTWNTADAKTWDAYLKNATSPISLQQSFAYGTAFENYSATPHRAVIEKNGRVIALCQMFQYKFLKLLPLIVVFRGPVWLQDISKVEKIEILHHLRQNLPVKRHLFSVESNLINTKQIKGFRRIITGASTIWIDLHQSQKILRTNLDGKWRNALVKAEKSDLIVKKLGKKSSDLDWLINLEKKQRKQRKYWALPDRFITDFIAAASGNSQPTLTMAALKDKKRVAGMMFLIHNNSATYHLGWSDDTGRQSNAHNLLLWQAMCELKKRGVHYLDLGGVNTEGIPGLTRFKLGTGGTVTTYAGTFMPWILG